MWPIGKDGYVLCGIVGGRVCIEWHSGKDGYVSSVIVGRTGMKRVA